MAADTQQGVVPQWTLQDKIRKAREHAGLSQQELADRLSVTRTSVINWERGHTVPLLALLRMVADQTGVDPRWLTEGWPSRARGGYVEFPRDSDHIPAGIWPDTTPARSLMDDLGSYRKKLPLGTVRDALV